MPSARKKRVEPGPKGRRWGSRWKATGAPRRLSRSAEGATGEVRAGDLLEGDGVQAARAGGEAGEDPGAGRVGDEGVAPADVPAAGLARDGAGEGEADDEAAGERDVAARLVHLEGGELDVGLLALALERRLVDEGLGGGEEP